MIEALQRILAGDAPAFILIAGPNGAGKSSFRGRRLDPLRFPCMDPDQIGRELFGRQPATREQALEATQEATRRVQQRFSMGQSVALESVFSDEKGHKLGLLEEARAAGFRTILIFIGVDHPQISIARVMDRAHDGGHDVPDELIEERFPRCFENLKKGIAIADLTILIDNSGCYGQDGKGGGLRHYLFGVLEKGAVVHLEAELPAWFGTYGVAAVIGR